MRSWTNLSCFWNQFAQEHTLNLEPFREEASEFRILWTHLSCPKCLKPKLTHFYTIVFPFLVKYIVGLFYARGDATFTQVYHDVLSGQQSVVYSSRWLTQTPCIRNFILQINARCKRLLQRCLKGVFHTEWVDSGRQICWISSRGQTNIPTLG